MSSRVILHVDFDYFYAQCEEIRKPELKTRPVCVCIFSDRGGDSGAIATCNYKAREFGVKSGMPIVFAKRKLETINSSFLPADFSYYEEISGKAMAIIQEYGDVFEYVGRDEAFLDITKKSEMSFEKAAHIGQQLKNKIKSSLGISCSVGIGPNKLIAKICSDHKKPDGLTIVKPNEVRDFLSPQLIRTIPGIGKKTEERLDELGINSIKDLESLQIFDLNKMFGKKNASYIFNASRGLDEEPVTKREGSLQYSRIVTLKSDSSDFEFILPTVLELCKELQKIIVEENKMFRSVTVQLVQTDLTSKSRSRMLKNPSNSLEELEKNSKVLLENILREQNTQVRRIGVKVSELSEFKGQSSLTSYF